MENRDVDIRDVHDAIAIRIIVHTKDNEEEYTMEQRRQKEEFLCYYMFQLIYNRFPSFSSFGGGGEEESDDDASRFKDYISNPKPNGYQSIHYTATLYWYGEHWPFEVQVRSEEMHRMAEFGVAAHWDYKLQGNSDDNANPNGETNTNNDVNGGVVDQVQRLPLVEAIDETTTSTTTTASSSPKQTTAATIDSLLTSQEEEEDNVIDAQSEEVLSDAEIGKSTTLTSSSLLEEEEEEKETVIEIINKKDNGVKYDKTTKSSSTTTTIHAETTTMKTSKEVTKGLTLDSTVADDAVTSTTTSPSSSSNDPIEETSNNRIASYIEALTTARDNLVQKNVFVFISPSNSALDGKILPLSTDACTVADALEEAQVRYGDMLLFSNYAETAYEEEEEDGEEKTCQVIEEQDVRVFAVSATDGLLDYIAPDVLMSTIAASLFRDDDEPSLCLFSSMEKLIYSAAKGWHDEMDGEYRDDIAVAASIIR
mmetsp:Transcript_25355/g.37196  ORF Transcript_25355/g.37196 Transcript_25355/m.37196 type:complete len:481 (+) Transcript_25355:237-1679(+)